MPFLYLVLLLYVNGTHVDTVVSKHGDSGHSGLIDFKFPQNVAFVIGQEQDAFLGGLDPGQVYLWVFCPHFIYLFIIKLLLLSSVETNLTQLTYIIYSFCLFLFLSFSLSNEKNYGFIGV